MVRILILYHSVHTKSPNYGMFGSLFIPKNKKLFLGIKSGEDGIRTHDLLTASQAL
jgi:hypothetical protein